MKKKILFWIFAAAGAGICFWVGLKIAPEEPTLRILGLFLYFYVCVELGTQYFISKRLEKEKQEKIAKSKNTP